MGKIQSKKLLFILIMLVGAVLRLVCLGSVPAGQHQDESLTAWNAYAIFHEGIDSAGHVLPVYMAGWGDGQSALYVWLTLPLVALGGGHLTPFLSRLPQAMVAIFTLLAVYAIMKHLAGEGAALWTSFVLAVCPWHVMMSRWGLEANLAPGFLMFGFYFFVRSLESERKRFLVLSAFFYGLSLYCYAVIWPIVPFMLLLQIIYGLRHGRLHVDRWSVLSAGLLFVMALPLLLFIAVNSGLLQEIRLPFMTIPVMEGYRGGEVAFTPNRMWSNLRTALSLLWHQNTGAPQDVLLPWGLFYDIGRVFSVLGAAVLAVRTLSGLWKREYRSETFLMIQLCGGGLVCLLVTAVLHQINALYIPLVLCQGYGIWWLLETLREKKAVLAKAGGALIALVYLVCLAGFQRDYYTEYRELADAYFGAGIRECVEYAVESCERTGIDTITVEKGAQWPRLLLYLETLPSEYLESVVYDVPPAPASFRSKDLLIRTRIDYDNISRDSIYIIYFVDREIFEQDYELVPFYDWYVAVPKKMAAVQPSHA
ncbi:MAG: glycosyltransferase family 39 protein [Butyrivibrio sp.]|nr:glycosyltransferase family 39 protein [Muribaculum sp.]MCM1551296.1 glycosyltransferase family 39 protein [Butyrivibrio sp.]